MTVVDVRDLNETEARALTERIKASVEHVWRMLLEAHERKAWKALDYDSWREYATAEFDMSESRAYQLLDQARVGRALEEATRFSTKVEISERAARELKPVLPDVTAKIQNLVRRGGEPAEVVQQVVAEARSTKDRLLVKPKSRNPIGQVVYHGVALAQSMNTLPVAAIEDFTDADDWLAGLDMLSAAIKSLKAQIRKHQP